MKPRIATPPAWWRKKHEQMRTSGDVRECYNPLGRNGQPVKPVDPPPRSAIRERVLGRVETAWDSFAARTWSDRFPEQRKTEMEPSLWLKVEGWPSDSKRLVLDDDDVREAHRSA